MKVVNLERHLSCKNASSNTNVGVTEDNKGSA